MVANDSISIDDNNGPLTPRELFRKLFGISWIKNDPILRAKLREIVLRWFDVKQLLEGPPVPIPSQVGDLECESGSKRTRCMSKESIVDVKSENTSRSVSTCSTPEPPVVSGWECKRCTFVNESDLVTTCGVCGWFKARSSEATGNVARKKKPEYPVEAFIKGRNSDCGSAICAEDLYSSILSRAPCTLRETSLTGPSVSQGPPATCTVYTSVYNLVCCGQAQEESTWMDALEKDVFAVHNLDEELIFRKRFLSAKAAAALNVVPECFDDDSSEMDEAEFAAIKSSYANVCNSLLSSGFPNMVCPPKTNLLWEDWIASGVHTSQYLFRLERIHIELIKEAQMHFALNSNVICSLNSRKLVDEFVGEFSNNESLGRNFFQILLDEPKCDLNVHCLSQVEGDNAMDRFMFPASMERASLIYTALMSVFHSDGDECAFVAARPPGHHCPSFEDRLIGLSASSCEVIDREPVSGQSRTPLEDAICVAHGICKSPPLELGMGFCSLNALAVAVKRFQQLENPRFFAQHGRSIRIAIVDLDIHAGNGTELVFRNNRSVLHLSVHRFGWLKINDGEVAERVMPGTHGYRDVGGIFGKHAKKPRGEGYAVNITLRKGDGNSEVLSGFEAVGIPILQQFSPDIVVIPCGFDGLKLSPVFTQRWGEASCPGMDAEYTPSLYGYLVSRIRAEVQCKVVAATEGGYDPLSVGLAARCVVKALKGETTQKPPMRTFNSEWIHQLNNIWQHQSLFWNLTSNR